jgi:hypothetical protein
MPGHGETPKQLYFGLAHHAGRAAAPCAPDGVPASKYSLSAIAA